MQCFWSKLIPIKWKNKGLYIGGRVLREPRSTDPTRIPHDDIANWIEPVLRAPSEAARDLCSMSWRQSDTTTTCQ